MISRARRNARAYVQTSSFTGTWRHWTLRGDAREVPSAAAEARCAILRAEVARQRGEPMARSRSLPAKLVGPAQAGTFRRDRLFSVLDRARPVGWVSGPPGAGKTTLVASYLEARRLRPIWYQVDG